MVGAGRHVNRPTPVSPVEPRGSTTSCPHGSSVVASAPGEVVYAGNGLGGYRHLVIVKHSDDYLSAYSMNVAPEVREGRSLGAGALARARGGQRGRSRTISLRD